MTATSPSTADHAVTLPDGTIARYQLRGLRLNTENGREEHADVLGWANFCASVFSYKLNPPPPAYFVRHFYNDPRRDPSLVRVLVHSDSEGGEGDSIASSVRIFRRTLSCAAAGPAGRNFLNTTVEAGGIGEVCTSPGHQRRGLSKILLKDAMSIMSEGGMGLSCSLLHASPDFRPVYSKVGGYQSVRSEWSIVPVRPRRLTAIRISDDRINDGWLVRQASFPEDALQLHRLHREYSEKRLITIVRTVQYWKEYVSSELGDTLWVMVRPAGDFRETLHNIVAWMAVRKRGGCYQLCEFGVDRHSDNSVRTSWAMERLLPAALDQAGQQVGAACEGAGEVPLLLPMFVLSQMKEEMQTPNDDAHFLDIGRAVREDDHGWMYLDFERSRPGVLELLIDEKNAIPHLIWPTDSF